MTIKDFSALCGCSTQTLRYYDRIGLLKPTRVDNWTGYRHYDKVQAIAFVKIKNLQAADFTIDEIKSLLTQPDEQVYRAFEQKIAAQEEKLERIRQIQQSYLAEKSGMEKIIDNLTGFLVEQLGDYEGLEEFGLPPEAGSQIAQNVREYMEAQVRKNHRYGDELILTVDDQEFRGQEAIADRIAKLGEEPLQERTVLLGDESVADEADFDPAEYDVLWERKGWTHVREFLPEVPLLEEGNDYCFLFFLQAERCPTPLSFPLFMLGAMILRQSGFGGCMSCTVEKSTDGQNCFRLLRKK